MTESNNWKCFAEQINEIEKEKQTAINLIIGTMTGQINEVEIQSQQKIVKLCESMWLKPRTETETETKIEPDGSLNQSIQNIINLRNLINKEILDAEKFANSLDL